MGMTPRPTAALSPYSSMTSPTINSSSLNSIETPGISQSQNQSKSLNQIRSTGPQLSYQGNIENTFQNIVDRK